MTNKKKWEDVDKLTALKSAADFYDFFERVTGELDATLARDQRIFQFASNLVNKLCSAAGVTLCDLASLHNELNFFSKNRDPYELAGIMQCANLVDWGQEAFKHIFEVTCENSGLTTEECLHKAKIPAWAKPFVEHS